MKNIFSRNNVSSVSNLKLPKTKFPLSMKNRNIEKVEQEIFKNCSFNELYKWQYDRKTKERFILHDGPPYANGEPHMGHALNKILKDITNRYKMLRGYKIHYQPGWDCHGMPIEQKIISNLKSSDSNIIRKEAAKFAIASASKQRAAFVKWGVMADWSSDVGTYNTMQPMYEANQISTFYDMYEKGFIYRNYMPIFWSPSSRTALAESEIEYKIKTSTQVYVKYELSATNDFLSNYDDGKKIHIIIWTTTPWTLPLNRAICYNQAVSYCLVKTSDNQLFITSLSFCEAFSQTLNLQIHKLADFSGIQLKGLKYECPFTKKHLNLLHANHVTSNVGTGLVHCSPAHGVEDFQVALKHNLPLDCYVDEKGDYTNEVPSNFSGKNVLIDADKLVIDFLGENVMLSCDYSHNYPHDWRTKLPVIYRASLQWFVDVVKLKKQITEILSTIKVYPPSLSNAMKEQLEVRDYWCISRQRTWGVPIPVFYSKDGHNIPLISRYSIDHLVDLFKTNGSDVWWDLPLDKLLPKHVIQKSGFDPSCLFEKGLDIFDIWFDSGVSWNLLQGDKADIYLEGIDQFNGWFQSSLITSIAVNQTSPFKSLVVHGFAIDEDGKKMSKSIGNVVDPMTITNGGTNTEKEPAYGVDALRFWAAASGLETNVFIGEKIISAHFEMLFKWRKVLRFLIGNLHDFPVHKFITLKNNGDLNFTFDIQTLNFNDQYLLHQLHDLLNFVTKAYDDYNFPRVVKLINNFITKDVSTFHSSISKDRLYCGCENERLSCQIAQFLVLISITKSFSPILPFLAEEIHLHEPLSQVCASIYKYNWINSQDNWKNDNLSSNYLKIIFPIRDILTSLIHPFKSNDFNLLVVADKLFLSKLEIYHENMFNSSLCEIMQIAVLQLIDNSNYESLNIDIYKQQNCVIDDSNITVVLTKSIFFGCPRCKRKIAKVLDGLCDRCLNIDL